jgi:glycosyltransferase involved in cell wall biosynthesis/predicted metal-dependent phosphoesterase TrpH
MEEPSRTRADLHCHSRASQETRLGVQRALGLPECATPPEEVYELAKRRGMDFVTITDHDTISGALEIADRPDVFISEELTARFRGEPQAVHVLCYGITPADHDWLQAHSDDLEACAEYLHSASIACALAHPFYAVAAPLTPRHRARLARLFSTWETRNGSRAPELNLPAGIYIETHGGTAVGGSDDHAGIDFGRTFTETPPAATTAEFIQHLRDGRAEARGDQGSAAKWAHSAMALAIRVLGASGEAEPPDPRAVLALVERVVLQGVARGGPLATDLGPADARALLRAWLAKLGVVIAEGELLSAMQEAGFSHSELLRRARRAHERLLREAVLSTELTGYGRSDVAATAGRLFEACVPVIPYVPAVAFLASEKRKLLVREAERPRVAVVADGIGGMHGVTRTLDEIRERGVPGFEVEVVGTDRNVDRRLSAVAEVDIPFYAGLQVGVPALPAVVETLADGRYDLVHVCSPGPAGIAAALSARLMGLPLVGSYHTELGAYSELRSGDARLRQAVDAGLAALYGRCEVVLSPSGAADASLRALGASPERIARWDRGVDLERFGPHLRDPDALPGELTVLYAGRLTTEKGVDLLAEAFLRARERDGRLHLVLAGGGPEEGALRDRLGAQASFLGWLEGEALALVYASADIFLFASRTDTLGQVILEAQASGLPVVAVAEGGPADLIDDGRSGMLRPPEPAALAGAVLELASSPPLRRRLAEGALAAASERTWQHAFEQLAANYRAALASQEHPLALAA